VVRPLKRTVTFQMALSYLYLATVVLRSSYQSQVELVRYVMNHTGTDCVTVVMIAERGYVMAVVRSAAQITRNAIHALENSSKI
jgi:hypothetical protein